VSAKGNSNSSEPTDRRIISVVTRLFYEKGYHGSTMREIAAGANIKAGSLYNHFPSKQALLMQISLEVTTALYQGALARLEGLETPTERMRAFVLWHVEVHAKQRLAARVADEQLHALEPRNRRRVLAIRDAHEGLLRQILEDGKREEGWRVADVAVVAFAIGTMCTQVDTWYREDGRLSPKQIGEIFADFILAGLSGRAELGDGAKKKGTAAKSVR
jgi:AcrR family transcriptional regulator